MQVMETPCLAPLCFEASMRGADQMSGRSSLMQFTPQSPGCINLAGGCDVGTLRSDTTPCPEAIGTHPPNDVAGAAFAAARAGLGGGLPSRMLAMRFCAACARGFGCQIRLLAPWLICRQALPPCVAAH